MGGGTAVAFIVAYYGARLIKRPWLRAATIVMFVGRGGFWLVVDGDRVEVRER